MSHLERANFGGVLIVVPHWRVETRQVKEAVNKPNGWCNWVVVKKIIPLCCATAQGKAEVNCISEYASHGSTSQGGEV